jgi:SAM-dependent methyltransferase
VGFAPALARWCAPDGPVLEVGVGTGAIALALRELVERPVLGLDLAPAMLAVAHERLGSVVGVADAQRMPVADASVGTLIASWVLHLGGNPTAMLAECRRVVRRDGRLLLVSARGEVTAEDMDAVMVDLTDEIRGRVDGGQLALLRDGMWIAAEDVTDEQCGPTRRRVAERTQGVFGVLLDVDDTTYDRLVHPMVEALRGLPDPRRPRTHVGRHRLFVLEPTGSIFMTTAKPMTNPTASGEEAKTDTWIDDHAGRAGRRGDVSRPSSSSAVDRIRAESDARTVIHLASIARRRGAMSPRGRFWVLFLVKDAVCHRGRSVPLRHAAATPPTEPTDTWLAGASAGRLAFVGRTTRPRWRAR